MHIHQNRAKSVQACAETDWLDAFLFENRQPRDSEKLTHDKARNHDFRRFETGKPGLCRANAMGLMEARRFTRFTMPSAAITTGLRPPDHRLTRFTMPSAAITTGLRPPDHRLTRFTMPSAPVTTGLRPPDHRLTRFTMPSAPVTTGLRPPDHRLTRFTMPSAPVTTVPLHEVS